MAGRSNRLREVKIMQRDLPEAKGRAGVLPIKKRYEMSCLWVLPTAGHLGVKEKYEQNYICSSRWPWI